ncbi:MAG: ribulose 1,5-bisphosphate carboxylase [Bacteroidales bacterium]|jgi:hypothetical protein|nr:ribulose 1,5-bisphosphate carboxylase [Bacteroidales bacterium]
MGFIKLTYNISNPIVSLDSIIQEIEYGSTFALYQDKEDIIVHQGKSFQWIDYFVQDDEIKIIIQDDFFHPYFFFEKFMTVFVYNLLDFGRIYLKEIDISSSVFRNQIQKNNPLDKYGQEYLKGTIFKPYYHLSNNQKIEQAKIYISDGINILKNDECYMKSKQELFEESRLLMKHIEGKAYFVPNITGYISDYDFIKQLMDIGIKIFMVDFLISGLSPVFHLKQKFPVIKIWGHRIGYIVIEKYVSMQVLAVLSILSGINYLHIGTPTNKELEAKKDLVNNLWAINPDFLPIFTKTTPEIIENLLPVFCDKSIYMACGYFRNKKGEIIEKNVKEWNNIFFRLWN